MGNSVHYVCLRFRLLFSLSLNGRMAIWRQNSCRITIQPFREKSVKRPNTFDRLYPNLTNGNSATVLSSNYHSSVQTQTQTQMEPEVFRKQGDMFRTGN